MNILIVRLGALGDVVHAIPAAAALRKAYPGARIDWLVDAKHRAIVDLVTAVDRTIVLESPTLHGWTALVPVLRRTSYDLAIDLQGLLKSAVLARASGAARVVGFSIWHLREKTARPFYSDTVDVGRTSVDVGRTSQVRQRETEHVITKNLRLLSAVGVDDLTITFPLATPPSSALDRLRDSMSGDRRFALINAGAAWPNKRWPPERFGEVAAFLRDACALTPVVLWGPGEEALAAGVVAASDGSAIVAPPTEIHDLVALSQHAALVVSGDTGPLHIATATGTPVVGLFGPTDPARNGPFVTEDEVVSRFDRCTCHYERRCHESDWCLADVTVPEVCAAIGRRLAAGAARGR
jgi:lipopolysaccharide heptosyltransferase I